MARIKSQATLDKGYIPRDAEALGLSIDPYNEYARLLLYDGKNFLPTATGYRSDFAKSLIGSSFDDPLPEIPQELLVYRTKAGDNILLALCPGGVYARTLDRAGTVTLIEDTDVISVDFSTTGSMGWTRLFYSTLGSTNPWQLWTHAIIRNELYLYQKGLKYIAKISGDELGRLRIDKLRPSFIISTAGRVFRYRVEFAQQFGNSTYKELTINGVTYRADVDGSVRSLIAEELLQEALISPYAFFSVEVGKQAIPTVTGPLRNEYYTEATTMSYSHDGQPDELKVTLEWYGNTAKFFLVRSWPEHDRATGSLLGHRFLFITDKGISTYFSATSSSTLDVGYTNYIQRASGYLSNNNNYVAVRYQQLWDESYRHALLRVVQTQDDSFEGASTLAELTEVPEVDCSDILEVNGILHAFSTFDARHYVSSDDGITWVGQQTTNFDLIADYESEIVYYNGNFISLRSAKHSPDGNTWINDVSGFGNVIPSVYDKSTCVAYGFGGQLYVLDTPSNRIYYSATGYSNWSFTTLSAFGIQNSPGVFHESPDGSTLWFIAQDTGHIIDIVNGKSVARLPINTDESSSYPIFLAGAYIDDGGQLSVIYEQYFNEPLIQQPFANAFPLSYDLDRVSTGYAKRMEHIHYRVTAAGDITRVTPLLDAYPEYSIYCFENDLYPVGQEGFNATIARSIMKKVF